MLQTLPYDVLRVLLRLLSGSDIAHVLTTCNSLYTLMDDDGVWQEQCARYKFTDRSIFDDATYREIYTLVLHTYWPLLGLWASDHPYRGSVIEFRYDVDYKGIVGEVWRWWAQPPGFDAMDLTVPKLPEYFVFFSVSLSASNTPRRAVISWHIHHNGVGYFGSPSNFLAAPTMHVLSETDQSLYLRYSAVICRLPDFPNPDLMVWYDRTRGPPRLKVEQAPVTSKVQNIGLINAVAFLYMAQTAVTKPAALVFHPPEPGGPEIFARHELPLQAQDLRSFDFGGSEPRRGPPFYRRFYPLRSPVLDGDDPTDERWAPASLEGIWLGAYATHSTEVLYVYFDEAAQAVRALKITGDFNVPRGVITWQFSLNDRMRIHDLPHDLPLAQRVFGDLSAVRIYRGTGTISAVGFIDEQRGESVNYIGIINQDEIRVDWRELDEYTPRYRRYRGRNLASETVDGNLRIPARWY
ncbi:uncharacterized protein PHACADRAFT_255176 [Phanerochaete carnosa HHB-10118-sp]|uniref:F-box domain-containing protein n=1 Tax=Phanerochaete carnosa (strain HHB-10118-sp) TaxID=650164 RepID=K5VTW8_PHACS|nr:uncharacterized protein PHACADRAFT_255176 [Phanerochaete carnosa HHB-10118-sp]EKM54943.1 hypothetical protein PHACADRAFT_255176 [Phanerochaete carnosa HHB-10118-sp]